MDAIQTCRLTSMLLKVVRTYFAEAIQAFNQA
ncbi:MAG: hypothetical protein JWO89_2260 [Verrucomicrobiaceae bacterium]|nr:hypothetical protein [Verrucomicrobiaceae bacterium]